MDAIKTDAELLSGAPRKFEVRNEKKNGQRRMEYWAREKIVIISLEIGEDEYNKCV